MKITWTFRRSRRVAMGKKGNAEVADCPTCDGTGLAGEALCAACDGRGTEDGSVRTEAPTAQEDDVEKTPEELEKEEAEKQQGDSGQD
jgi:DnaJ-class molecular chaperone